MDLDVDIHLLEIFESTVIFFLYELKKYTKNI